MPSELRPGLFTQIMARVVAEAHARNRPALAAVALAVEKQAKINASNGAHVYGTPTPARYGEGPARISGTLVRSITHSPITAHALGLQTRVGVASGFYPKYPPGPHTRGHTSRTPSSVYGKYLEVTGVRSGHKFPFLRPAFRIAPFAVPTAFRVAYAVPWPVHA